LIKVLTGSTL